MAAKAHSLLINCGFALLKCPSKLWQCDSEPRCTMPGPWNWSGGVDSAIYTYIYTQISLLLLRHIWTSVLWKINILNNSIPALQEQNIIPSTGLTCHCPDASSFSCELSNSQTSLTLQNNCHVMVWQTVWGWMCVRGTVGQSPHSPA